MAIKKIYELAVDLKRTSVRVNIPVLVQGDSAEFRIRLLDNGAELSTEQLTGITSVKMQSGYDAQTVIQTVGTLQGSVAVFRLKKNELFRSGTVQAMVQLEDTEDRISTLRFQYQVIPDLSGNYIPGEQDVTVFQRYMNDAQVKIDEINAAAEVMAATDVAQLTVKLADKAEQATTANIQNQVNNLVLGAVGDGNNPEVLQARGDFNLLNERLNVVNDAINNNHSFDKSKVDSLEIGVIAASTGNISTNYPTRSYTPFINAKFLSHISISGNFLLSIRLYSDTQQYIPTEDSSFWKKTIINNYNVPYVRVVVKKSDESDITETDRTQILTNLVVYNKASNDAKYDFLKNIATSALNEEKVADSELTIGIVEGTSGTLNPNYPNRSYTRFLRKVRSVKLNGDKYLLSVREYDAAKNYIVPTTALAWEPSATNPNEVEYMRLVIRKTDNTNLTQADLIDISDKLEIFTDTKESLEYGLKISTVTNSNSLLATDDFNSLMLVAVKMKKEPNKLPYTVGYLYLDVFNGNKFYYSNGVPDRPVFVFDWDESKSVHPPTEYNCFIADNGDVIFAYKNELFKDVRNPAIVYSAPDYEATVISFADKNNPTGWLQNCGVDNVYADGSIIFAEYIRATSDNMRVWKVSKPYNNPANWQVVLELQRTDLRQEINLKHFHTVQVDTYTGFIYAFTGDDNIHSRIYVSQDNGNNFTLIKEGPEKHTRVLNLIYDEDNIYWGTDGGKAGHHIFMRCGRDSNGVMDVNNFEEVYIFPDHSVRFSTYATCLIMEPYGILFLDRFDAPTQDDLPIRFYDLKTNKIHLVAMFKSLVDSPIMYGFRNEAVNFYPSYADNRVVCGFVNYPNNMDTLINTPSSVNSKIGISEDYLTNKDKINNLTIEVVRKTK